MWFGENFIKKKIETRLPSENIYPPLGSVQFRARSPRPGEDIPPGFKYYEFGPNWDESDPAAIEMGKKILEELFRERKVLTEIYEYACYSGRGKRLPLRFVNNYADMLRRKKWDASNIYEAENERLFYIFAGYDKELFPAYCAKNGGGLCSFSFYLFSRNENMQGAEDAMKKVSLYQHEMKIDFFNHGPSVLEMQIRESAGAAKRICDVIEEVCLQNGILLVKPHES